jgi:hypothetical protein
MVHQSIGDHSRVADEFCIKRVLLTLKDFLFFCLYSFSCIANQLTTLKQLRLLSCFMLISSVRISSTWPRVRQYCYSISPTPDHAHYTNRCWAVNWLTVVPHCILKFNLYIVKKYILIISKHQSTNIMSPVLFNL